MAPAGGGGGGVLEGRELHTLRSVQGSSSNPNSGVASEEVRVEEWLNACAEKKSLLGSPGTLTLA